MPVGGTDTNLTPAVPRKRGARWMLALKVLVSVGLLSWLGRGIIEREGIDELWFRASHLAAVPLSVAVALHFVAVSAGVLRWRVLLRARNIELPFMWLVRSFLIGRFIGAFTPSSLGLDGWRAYDVGRRTAEPLASAGVIVVEKLFGVAAMALVTMVLAPLGVLEGLGPSVVPVAAFLVAAAATAIALLSRPRLVGELAARAPGLLKKPAERIARALGAATLTPLRAAAALALGILTHCALSGVFAATGAALGVQVPWFVLFAVGNAITLAVLMPISMGGVGVREGVAVVLLSRADVDWSDATLLALLGWLTGQVPAILGGLLFAIDRREFANAAAVAAQTRSDSVV